MGFLVRLGSLGIFAAVDGANSIKQHDLFTVFHALDGKDGKNEPKNTHI
jgi:hypothetical protein